jgi:hypothetical protein
MRSRFLILPILLVAAACAEGTNATTTSVAPVTTVTPSTTAAPTTTAGPSSTEASTTTTTTAPGLDLSDRRWVLHTIDGIEDDAGTLLFDSDPLLGETNLVRDHEGGIVFTDTFGLWWWRSGETDPDLVLDGAFLRLIEAIPTANGPVVRLAGADDRYVDIANLVEVAPIPGGVEIGEDFSEVRRAYNGLTATVTQPEVTLDPEGFPDQVVEPAHLIVTRNGEVQLDLRIGGPVEAYARIHDFDGRRLIVSRAPYEPALPPETYLLVDLACDGCTETFVEAAATAALTGPDVDWAGDVVVPGGICGAWDPEYGAAPGADLPTLAGATRASLLRTAAACDLTGLRSQLAVGAELLLGHGDINPIDIESWFEEGLVVLGDLPDTLGLPWRQVDAGDTATFVFPSWFAVESWDELNGSEQAAMTARYGDAAPRFWSDYPSIAVPGDLSVTIAGTGEVVRIERPLS